MARAEPPQLLPTRDVDITYDVTLPSQPRVRERCVGLQPSIAVFSTGGTIASKRGADGAASPNLTAEELKQIPLDFRHSLRA